MIENLDEVALELANKELEAHFDAEAYIVKYIAEKKLCNTTNLVPDSDIDDYIQELLNLFVVYNKDSNLDTLGELLAMLRQVISELYHTRTSKPERDLIRQSIILSQQIYS